MNRLMRGFFDKLFVKYSCKKYKYFKTPLTEKNFKKRFIHVPKSKILYINLSGWHTHLSTSFALKKRVLKKEFSFLNYEFPEGVLSSDEKLTKKDFLKMSEIVKKDIKDYKKRFKFKKIVVVGASLGGVIGFLVTNGNKNVDKFVSICTGYDLAESLWTGIVTKKLRKKFEKKKITLKKLKKAWEKITPANNVNKLKDKEIILFLSQADKVIDYSQGEKMFKALKNKKYKVDLHVNKNLGHYLTIYFSYKKYNFLND
jgi:hypothetical protein